MANKFIGIDPGSGGGIAVVGEKVLCTSILDRKKITERDVYDFLLGFSNESVALIERVGAYRVEGRQQGAKSMFTFGQSYGFLRGVLVALGIPFDEVAANSWQSHFKLRRTDKSETTTAKKNRHKAKAQQLFPSLKITHGIADALLIAEYCRRESSF